MAEETKKPLHAGEIHVRAYFYLVEHHPTIDQQ
jgi:hypothetical protein